MIKSMTGFGQHEASDGQYSIKIELKSVNHRYLDLYIRTPKQYSQLEEVIRTAIQGRIARGRVEVIALIEDFGEKGRNVKINHALVDGYLEALRALQNKIGNADLIKLSDLLGLPDVLEIEEPELDWDNLNGLLLEALGGALDRLEKMRRAEGESLYSDLEEKITQVQFLAGEISKLSAQVIDDYRERLKEHLADLLDGTTISEERFLGEVAIFADKCSIDEELVRLTSHIRQFRESLRSHDSVGRKLDFLLQEMNREVNTIGSKGNNVHIAGLVVELKSELEKIREQVQNIE